MTFNAGAPQNSDSPAIFTSQNQTNMSRLQTLLGADHQFNLSAASDDGYHNIIHMTQQAPSGALAATGRSYVKSSGGRIHQFYMDDQGTEYQLSPGMPIRASVNFAGNGGNGAQAIRSQYNVTEVERTGTGQYIVKFTRNMPDANYIVHLTGMRTGTNQDIFGSVTSDNSYSASVTTASVKITFYDGSSVNRDAFMGNVTIFSVT